MIYFSGLRYPLSETNRKYQDKTDRDEMHLLTCIVNTAAPRAADMTHTLLSDSALLHCRAQTHTHTHTHTHYQTPDQSLLSKCATIYVSLALG